MMVFGYILLDIVEGAAVIIVTNKDVEIMGTRRRDHFKFFKLSILSNIYLRNKGFKWAPNDNCI
jgi:hypothetical protein